MSSRTTRWVLLAGAVLVMGAAVFLATDPDRGGEEIWRQCQQELAAKGEVLEWSAFIPAHVPDEKNFCKAPGMTAWFSRRAWQTNRVTIFALPAWVTNPPVSLSQLRAMPELELAPGAEGNAAVGSRTGLRAWFARLEPEYRLLVDASARPSVRFNTDYSRPMDMDVPNFINLRSVAQALASHASLSLVDGKPDIAVQDLFLLRRLADLSGCNSTLVATMIRVAILGLYTQTARDILESGALSEPQLKAIQEQLAGVNLLESLAQSLRVERAWQVWLLRLPLPELQKTLQPVIGSVSLELSLTFWRQDWKAWFEQRRLKSRLRSRGWLCENIAFNCRLLQEALDQMKVSKGRAGAAALGQVLGSHSQTLTKTLTSAPRSAQLAALILPNYSRAGLKVLQNQVQLDQLRVMCALERYRLVQGSYPEKLEALAPTYLELVPNDLFAEQNLQYHRLENGGYRFW